MQLLEAKTKCEVDALKECIDLIRNGYTILFSCGCEDGVFYKFKHHRNWRILTVKIMPNYYEIKEHGQAIKHVDYPG